MPIWSRRAAIMEIETAAIQIDQLMPGEASKSMATPITDVRIASDQATAEVVDRMRRFD
jgi:hypothetical protein